MYKTKNLTIEKIKHIEHRTQILKQVQIGYGLSSFIFMTGFMLSTEFYSDLFFLITIMVSLLYFFQSNEQYIYNKRILEKIYT